MIEKCIYCENEFDGKYGGTTRTTDNKVVCLSCYHTIFNVFFKGVFSSNEGEMILKHIKQYDDKITEYMISIKKLLILNEIPSEDIGEYFNKIVGEEEKVGLLLFNASRQPVVSNIYKHIQVIQFILNNNLLNPLFKLSDTFAISINYSSDIDTILRIKEVYTKYNNSIISRI